MLIVCTSDLTTNAPESNGITFNLSSTKTVRRSILNEPLVVVGGGSVDVTSVSPAWDGEKNGSMKNPNFAVATQGYDTGARAPSVLRLTYDGATRATFPVTLSAGDRLVATIGRTVPTTAGGATFIEQAAVLTAVETDPGPGAFRPSVAGGDSQIWTTDDADYNILLGLAVPSGTALIDMSASESFLNKIWLEHGNVAVWNSQTHPGSHGDTSGYQAYYAFRIAQMSVQCLLDDPNAESIANRLIQYGIDCYHASLVNGEVWARNGGHGWGRKWPILFAGLMLDDANLKAPPYYVTGSSGQLKFQEDAYTYYGDPGGTTARWGADSTVCIEAFTSNHSSRPTAGDVDQWEMKYLYTTTAANPNGEYINGGGYELYIPNSMVSFALAAQMLEASVGAKTLWGHDAFFDYVERRVSTITPAASVAYPANSLLQLNTDAKIDTNLYGGSGNLLMKRCWEEYHP